MKFLEELKKIGIDLVIEKTYIKGNIDKFIKELNKSSDSEELEEMFLYNKSKEEKQYLRKIAEVNRKMELICAMLRTTKLDNHKQDLIKIGSEMLKISQEIIEIGKESI